MDWSLLVEKRTPTGVGAGLRAPRASLWRRVWWTLRGGPARLRAAQARREALFGDPLRAMNMLVGVHTSAMVIVEAALRGLDGDSTYRSLVLKLAPRPTRRKA